MKYHNAFTRYKLYNNNCLTRLPQHYGGLVNTKRVFTTIFLPLRNDELCTPLHYDNNLNFKHILSSVQSVGLLKSLKTIFTHFPQANTHR